jgi:hypothetical protein
MMSVSMAALTPTVHLSVSGPGPPEWGEPVIDEESDEGS